jgi:glycosyltransferase A (GT-A) superfamily protein (DUF2064 family)
VVFCRRPSPGVGKQRLAAAIGAPAAAAAAELLLAAALEDASQWPGPVALAPATPADVEWAGALLARPCTVVAQPAGNLGERLNGVDAELRATGAARLIFVGSDAPALDTGYYNAARAALEHSDVVLGPALDGGVTLMGSRRPWPDLAPLPWSSARLRVALATLCAAQGLSVAELDARADVDHAADLDRACRDLADDPRPARQRLVQWWRTRRRRQGNTP